MLVVSSEREPGGRARLRRACDSRIGNDLCVGMEMSASWESTGKAKVDKWQGEDVDAYTILPH